MPNPQIFISHSATGDQDATNALEMLSLALDREGFEVLVDKQRLQLGDNWRRQLYLWMQQCHGAVILFSKGALESDWVYYEATVLTTRKYLEPDFTLIPIPIAPVKRDELANSRFSPMVINELHQSARTNTLDVTIHTIIERFAPLKQSLSDSPMQRLERVIIPWLKQLDRDVLLDAAREMGVQVEVWPQDTSKCRVFLVQELLKADLYKVCQALKILAPQLDRNNALNMLTILAPSWVDERAVAPIPEVVKRPQSQRTICINSKRILTGEMYIRRASNTYPEWPMLKLNNISLEHQIEALKNEIYAEDRRKWMVFDDDSTSEVIDSLLNDTTEELDPRFILVNGYLEEEILTETNVTFFLLSGDKDLDLQEMKLNYIEFLLPKLDPNDEARAYKLYFEAKRIVGDSHSGV